MRKGCKPINCSGEKRNKKSESSSTAVLQESPNYFKTKITLAILVRVNLNMFYKYFYQLL